MSPTSSPPRSTRTARTANFTVTLKYEASTDQAISAVGDVRDVAHADAPPGTKALVGGMSSIYKDIDAAVEPRLPHGLPASPRC